MGMDKVCWSHQQRQATNLCLDNGHGIIAAHLPSWTIETLHGEYLALNQSTKTHEQPTYLFLYRLLLLPVYSEIATLISSQVKCQCGGGNMHEDLVMKAVSWFGAVAHRNVHADLVVRELRTLISSQRQKKTFTSAIRSIVW